MYHMTVMERNYTYNIFCWKIEVNLVSTFGILCKMCGVVNSVQASKIVPDREEYEAQGTLNQYESRPS